MGGSGVFGCGRWKRDKVSKGSWFDRFVLLKIEN
jgi:hypothetical protein